LALVALSLPSRRPFDTTDQLDERLRRADGAFALAYELGTSLVLARPGPFPPEADMPRRDLFKAAITSLAETRAHRGVRLAIEPGSETGRELKPLLDTLNMMSLAASVDPTSLLRAGIDPAAAVIELNTWVAHAYTGEAPGSAASAVFPRGVGFSPGALDWAAYLGALEEIGYRGFLTIWP